eukprot:3403237-Pyramimonas_sp.AAC.1
MSEVYNPRTMYPTSSHLTSNGALICSTNRGDVHLEGGGEAVLLRRDLERTLRIGDGEPAGPVQ